MSSHEELYTNARLLNDIQLRKLRYFGHVVRADNLCTSILHGRIAGTHRQTMTNRLVKEEHKQVTTQLLYVVDQNPLRETTGSKHTSTVAGPPSFIASSHARTAQH